MNTATNSRPTRTIGCRSTNSIYLFLLGDLPGDDVEELEDLVLPAADPGRPALELGLLTLGWPSSAVPLALA